jgi:hypothetical protein
VKTVKTSRRFNGSPISLRGLSRLEDRSFPVKLSDILADDESRHFSGSISAGDVDCRWQMDVWRNGFWSVKADFHDNGIIAGDFFSASFLLDKARSVGIGLKGSILDPDNSRELSVGNSGSDRWIRENWRSFEASGPSVRLSVKVAAGVLVGKPLAIAAIIIAAAASPSGGGDTTTTITPCFDQDPSGRPCVEIRDSVEGPQ